VFAVSIACEDAAGALAGVVLDPVRDECFAATRSETGATLNGRPIHCSSEQELSMAMVATGFGYDPEIRARQAAVAARLIPVVRDVRRFGAAALDLCWAACGRVDAFYERALNSWDIAAGALVCERAGLDVRELPGMKDVSRGILVAPPGLTDALIALVDGD
jgi:myo-inositol-1(or 4)-monophosphatase